MVILKIGLISISLITICGDALLLAELRERV
jgi:hypothetical protein